MPLAAWLMIQPVPHWLIGLVWRRLAWQVQNLPQLEIDPPVVDVPLEDQHADGAEEEPLPELLAGGLLPLLGLHLLVADLDLLGRCQVALAAVEQIDSELLIHLRAGALANVVHTQLIRAAEDIRVLQLAGHAKLVAARRGDGNRGDRRGGAEARRGAGLDAGSSEAGADAAEIFDGVHHEDGKAAAAGPVRIAEGLAFRVSDDVEAQDRVFISGPRPDGVDRADIGIDERDRALGALERRGLDDADVVHLHELRERMDLTGIDDHGRTLFWS